MQEVDEIQKQNCVGLAVQREARCTNDLLGFSDSSLLFLAAKAIDGKYDLLTECVTFDNGFTYLEFDPINDEAHALRLLIRLELQIHFVESSDCFWVSVSLPAHSDHELEQDLKVFDTVARKNVDACTRRAIVLAAAQIGRART